MILYLAKRTLSPYLSVVQLAPSITKLYKYLNWLTLSSSWFLTMIRREFPFVTQWLILTFLHLFPFRNLYPFSPVGHANLTVSYSFANSIRLSAHLLVPIVLRPVLKSAVVLKGTLANHSSYRSNMMRNSQHPWCFYNIGVSPRHLNEF